MMKVSLKTVLSATTLAGGVWLACLNPAPASACIQAETSLPSLTSQQLGFLRVGFLSVSAGAGVALLAALSLTRNKANSASSMAIPEEDLLENSSFSIPIYPDEVESTAEKSPDLINV